MTFTSKLLSRSLVYLAANARSVLIRFVKAVDRYGMRSGIVKVVPPKEWSADLDLLSFDAQAYFVFVCLQDRRSAFRL